MFNACWHLNRFDKQWPPGSHDYYLKCLVRKSKLEKAYDHVEDFVGGRVIVSCMDDVHTCVRWLKRELASRRYKIVDRKFDRDYVRDPKQGYYAYHFLVEIPLHKRGKKPDYQLAELQIQSLLGNAWSEFGHDTVYKKIKVPGNQVLTAEIVRGMGEISYRLQKADSSFGRLRTRIES